MTQPTAARSFDKSSRYHATAARVIAGSVNSNVRLAGTPMCFVSASGSRIVDVDGNSYIDYAMGMGPVILGHSHPRLVAAITETATSGQMYAGQHPAELELALLAQKLVPSAERVRFGMTGSEMVQAALRVARASTGRDKVIKFEGHYHGWFDNVLASVAATPNDPEGNVPFAPVLQSRGQTQSSVQDLFVMPWNNIGALTRCFEARGKEIAAVLMEPMMCNTGAILPLPGYLQMVRRLCDEFGAVLIFDEVITGFRLSLAGAQGLFGVYPDLSTFAKAIGGGYPLAMLAGQSKLMELISTGAVNHSGTYNSNVLSIAAGVATLQALSENDGAVIGQIDRTGQSLVSGLQDLGRKHRINLYVSGVGSVFNTSFTDQEDVVDYASFKRAQDTRLAKFLAQLLLRGVRPTSRGTWFVSAAHTKADVETTLRAADGALGEL